MTTSSNTGIAARLEALISPLAGGALPVHLTVWDGSSAGPTDAPHVTLNSPQAIRRLLWHPGELGAAQAYVTGELEVEGDLVQGLSAVRATLKARGVTGGRPPARTFVEATKLARELGVLGTPLRAPATQIAVRGRLHSVGRDRDVIHNHYDLSNEFYSLILDDHMAYSSAYVTGADLDGEESEAYSLEDAQRDKLDLVCRKAGLDKRPGMRFLDIGCGWGSLSLHAASAFGAQVTGVTISKEQKAFIDARIAERGLGDKVEIRLQDYREIDDPPFEAVASLEMGEHVGERNYATYADTLARCASDEAQIVIQQMSRHDGHPGGGPFIEAYIAPDMTMRPVGQTVAFLERAGLEVRDVHAMREHYVWTVRAWQRRFEASKDQLTKLVGEEVVRVWELYLAGGLLAFQDGRMGVDQITAVRRRDGMSALPAVRPASWSDPRV
ncbi:cyclopropane-fatty-acyl-phospholipid synthase family protein [Dermatophilaceae bacterium Sec6.4]